MLPIWVALLILPLSSAHWLPIKVKAIEEGGAFLSTPPPSPIAINLRVKRGCTTFKISNFSFQISNRALCEHPFYLKLEIGKEKLEKGLALWFLKLMAMGVGGGVDAQKTEKFELLRIGV